MSGVAAGYLRRGKIAATVPVKLDQQALYRANTRSQARDLETDPSTGQGMITRWPRDCST